MYGKRFLMKALVGLLVIALLIGVASSMQRNAWMQGYMMGQLSAGGDGSAAIPYVVYGLQGYGGPPWGGGLGPYSLVIASRPTRASEALLKESHPKKLEDGQQPKAGQTLLNDSDWSHCRW